MRSAVSTQPGPMASVRELISFSLGRLQTSFKQRGVRGTIDRALYYAGLYLTPTGLEERRFDSRFGVQTAGVICRQKLGLTTPNVSYASEYSTTPVGPFLKIMNLLDIDHREWVFVDIGSGKGKVMLLASRFPFKRVIGIEFSPELTRIAEENLAKYNDPRRRCHDATVVCKDATEYAFPLEKSVIFFNNPFRGPVLECVIQNLAVSVETHARELYIVYWNPFCADLFEQASFLTEIRHAAQYRIYRSCVPGEGLHGSGRPGKATEGARQPSALV